MTHARRIAEQLRIADEELEREVEVPNVDDLEEGGEE
jgi:hypothetical protein